MATVPDKLSREDLMKFLILKSHQLSPKMKQIMLSDLKTFKAHRQQEEAALMQDKATLESLSQLDPVLNDLPSLQPSLHPQQLPLRPQENNEVS